MRVCRFYRPEVRRGCTQLLLAPLIHIAKCAISATKHSWQLEACRPLDDNKPAHYHSASLHRSFLINPPAMLSFLLQETPFAGMAAPGQLFRSNHVDDRLGLAAVQRRCCVMLLPAGQQAAAGAAGGADACGHEATPSFTCQLQLDHEQMVLGVLPPDCLPAQPVGAAAGNLHR